MSSNLYWIPIIEQEKESLPDRLKHALQKGFNNPVNVTLNSEHSDYLCGLRDAGISEAQILIDAIYKYGSIKMTEEY